jgi:hypothetical protein
MQLSYTVAGIPGEIIGASLAFNGAAAGAGASASVDLVLEGVGSLRVSRPGELADSLAPIFGNDLSATMTISLTSVSGGAAQISLVAQGFEVVPEPGTALLLLLGTGGLLALRRRA